MRIFVRPSQMPDLAIDVTNALIATLASELARVQGGNLENHWQEAAQLVERLSTQQVVGPCFADSPGLRDRLSGTPACSPASTPSVRGTLETFGPDALGVTRDGRGQVPREPGLSTRFSELQ